MIDKNKFRIDCDCGHPGHFFTMGEWCDDDGSLWAIIYEAGRDLPFWTRLKYGITYILNPKNNLNYLEVIFKKEDVIELQKFINKMIKKYE